MKQLLPGLIFLTSAVWTVSARIFEQGIDVFYIDYNVEVGAQAHPLMEKSFGFQENGDIQFSMNCDDPEPPGGPFFWLLFCSAADAREFSRMTPSQLNFDCQRMNGGSREFSRADHCKRHMVDHNASHSGGQYSFYRRMDTSAFYTLLLLQCPSPSVKNSNISEINVLRCKSRVVTLNPGGTQLSSDEIPLPLIYTVINLVWATLMAAWFFNWVIYFKFSNRLHRLISCAPIFKVILVVLILLWWQEIANTGVESTDISTLKEFVQSIEDALLFMTQMMIAEGWGVVRCHIKHYRWTSLLMLFAVFSTSLMCVYWVHKYFLAFSVCCVVFMMYKTLKWSSHNIELLRRRRRKIRRFIARHNLRYKGSVTIDIQLCQKLNIYHRFRIICASFSMVYAIARTLATFLQEYSYIRALTFELPELLVYLAIGFLFRLRNFEPYENIELVPPRENVVVFELPDVCINEVQPHVVLGVPLHFKVEKETQTPRRRWRTGVMSQI